MAVKYNFTDEQKREMVELYVGGTSAREIRRAFDMKSESTLYAILHENHVVLHSKRSGLKFQRIDSEKVAHLFETPIDETLPERKTAQKRFRVTLKVRLTFESDTMEGAIAKAKGYNGFQEVLSVSRVG